MIKEAISVINQMLVDGIICRYAIGGAIGATFYLEPVSTVDLDIFIALEPQPGQLLISLQPVYDYLKNKNAVPEGEYILIARNGGRIFTEEFKVRSGFDQDIEILDR